MTTMRDVADRAGVSAKTVSRVINNDRYVSADVRMRVERAIVELQYVPNMLAVTFRAGRDAAIGVAVPGVADPFFAGIIDAVEQEASKRNVAVIVTSVGWEPSHEQRSLEAVLKRQVAGMIICPVGRDMSYLRPWLKRTPLVFVDREPGRLTADAVVQDDVGGGHDGTRHLIAHGHRHIAFMGDDTVTGLLRLEGWQQALDEAGLPAGPVHIGAVDVDTITAALRRALDAPQPPTAVFSSNARCTIALVTALQTLRRKDIALIGFGDFPTAAALQPAITVVHQDGDAMGRFAADRLFTRLDAPTRRLRRRTVLPVSLVTRASCAMPGEKVRVGHRI
ncbi:LacI family DNA-binding transcriptional regulator [Mycolicibacterium flavescens]|uniref:LacI family transcriptional regulator n=1 Tax=Mycolicibacterium flavescens TaxID=1776 RepID=A0A1E3RQL5_MYCFV|nr:LacI family DNA-binding transcriptional regulator [Mycolicibacterium flavescens]MCV7279547.1 LacI family DNA-binding transcriptional regulator [Mycolicibacterium flavescens]ODQ92206.1 LacI family transcriptional regulator [Mycolicibacterium flavescens]